MTATLDDAQPPVLLLSIHPVYAEAILIGKKTVELRRTPVRRPVKYCALYSTAPVKAIVGVCRVVLTVTSPPPDLWRSTRTQSCISRRGFDKYFEGCAIGCALYLRDAERCYPPVTLDRVSGGIRPPQSFRYLPYSALENQLAGIANPERTNK